MWLIDHVIQELDTSLKERVRCIYRGTSERNNQVRIKLRLRNTETDAVLRIESTQPDFDDIIERYQPYGYVNTSRAFQTGFDWNADEVFLEIDGLSWQFLNYVDSVNIVGSKDELAFIRTLPISFTPWDELRTIFEWEHSIGIACCTLLQLMCYMLHGWKGDKFYIRTGKYGYCVEFTDVEKAKTLIAKASALGHNPLLQAAKALSLSGLER